MTIEVTMLTTRMGEAGTYWEAGQTYAATEPFARELVAINAATATFTPEQANKPVFVRASGDGLELVMTDNTASQVTGAWEGLRFPAQGINPAGAASPPSVDEVLTSFTGTLLFSGSQENVIAGVAQMPHAWRVQSAIRPHIHWATSPSARPMPWRGSCTTGTWAFRAMPSAPGLGRWPALSSRAIRRFQTPTSSARSARWP
jgi:hypothetical protein